MIFRCECTDPLCRAHLKKCDCDDEGTISVKVQYGDKVCWIALCAACAVDGIESGIITRNAMMDYVITGEAIG